MSKRSRKPTEKPEPREQLARQELHCHACQRYVQFTLDLSLNGNHVLNCPNCGHEHCRVVRNGQITGIRWDQRNGATFGATFVTCGLVACTAASTSTATTTLRVILSQSWTGTQGTY